MTELPRRLIRISASLAAGGLSATVLATAADPGVEAPPPRGTVAFVSDRAPNRGGELYSVDAGGKRRNALTRAPLTADFALTPSHDRRKVAFVSNRDGTWAVWVMASQGGRAHRVGRLGGEPGAPTISWDRGDARLAFDTGGFEGVRPEVWVASVGGGRPRRIGVGWRPDWSAQGDRIAFERFGGDDDESRTVVVTPTGRVLWSRPGYAPQWSPDGRRLAFETPKGAVALATPSGRVIRRLGRQIDGHAWLPDGRHLALVGRRIWVVTTTGRIVFTSPADADAVVWSRDGRRIAYRARAGIFVARLGGRPRRVSRAGSWLLDWSPDGRRLAAVTQGPRGPVLVTVRTDGRGTRSIATETRGSEIRTAYWAGDSRLLFESHAPRRGDLYLRTPRGAERRLTAGVARYDTPDWSPDGTRLVASRTDVDCARDCPSDIAVIDSATGRAVRITTGRRDEDRQFAVTPRWSPDGRLIAFVRTGPAGDSIRIVSVDGRGERVLVQPDGDARRAAWPAWSPDGRRLAFIGEGVMVVGVDGTGTRQIADAPEEALGTAWSPDGNRIAWREGATIKIAPAAGDAPPLVLRNAALSCRLTTPSFWGTLAWSADGRRLTFAGCSRSGTALANLDLWSVRADGTGLTRLTGSLAWDRDPAVR